MNDEHRDIPTRPEFAVWQCAHPSNVIAPPPVTGEITPLDPISVVEAPHESCPRVLGITADDSAAIRAAIRAAHGDAVEAELAAIRADQALRAERERDQDREHEYRRKREAGRQALYARMARWTDVPERTWRMHDIYSPHIPSIIAKYKTLGRTVRDYLHDETDVGDVASTANNINVGCTSALFNRLVEAGVPLDDDHFICQSCGEIESQEDNSEVVAVGRGDYETWCWSCLDGATYSQCMGEYYDSAISSVPVYESVRAAELGRSDDRAPLPWARHSLYQSQTDGDIWFTDEDDCAEYDMRNSDDYLPDYHSTSRSFIETSSDKSPCLGVELEVASYGRRDTIEALRYEFEDELILERDSSLSDLYGFEIVTQPLGRTEWAELAPRLLDTLKASGARGYNAPAGCGYGIHVNIHRRHLSPLQEQRMMLFLCDVENRDFSRVIAQRESIYSARVDIGAAQLTVPGRLSPNGRRATGCLRRDYMSGVAGQVMKIEGAGKYAPIAWHWESSSVAEFRIFQSTLHLPSFMKNLEFVWALVEWTNPATCSGTGFNHRDFVAWLSRPENRKVYPNLVDYINRPQFQIKGGAHITSTWSDIMFRPHAEEMSFPLAA